MQKLEKLFPKIITALAILATLVLANYAIAQKQSVGKIIEFNGKVVVTRVTGEKVDGSTGLEIFQDDEIKTGANSSVKIEFNDKTVLSLFEDSEIKISEFVYVPAQNQRDAVVDLVKGEVRSAVSKTMSEKSTYKVKTKNSVMGIRGTTTLSRFGRKGLSPISVHGVEEGLAFVAKPGQDVFTEGVAISHGMMAIFIGNRDPIIEVLDYNEFPAAKEQKEKLTYNEPGKEEKETVFDYETGERTDRDELYDLLDGPLGNPATTPEPIETPIEPQCPLY